MKPKRFEIIISGKFCPVPHPDRIIQIDLKDTDESFDDKDLFVVLHEVLCKMKKSNLNSEAAEPLMMINRFEKYHSGEDEYAKLHDIKIVMSGVYCEEPYPDREIIFDITEAVIDRLDIMVVIFETLCNIRNHFNMTRDEINNFASKFEIYNFGMRKEEQSFVARGAEDGVKKFI